MRDRRDKMKIIQDILEVATDPQGARKTHLVYGANLNFNRLERYLEILLDRELIEIRENPETRYFISQKGREFIKHSKSLREML